jgi:ribonuclease HI
MEFMWGVAGAAAAATWGSLHGRLLLPLVTEMEQLRQEVEHVSIEEAAIGAASLRSERSLYTRATAIMLVTRLVAQLESPSSATGALPGHLHKRVISRAIKDVLFPSDRPVKPAWWNVEALVKKASWPLQTRSSCGYPYPEEVLPEGHHPFISANGLIEAAEATCGYLPDDSILWTVAKEVHGHSIVVSDQLQEKINECLAKGHPLFGYDPDKLEPMPAKREAEAFWAEIQRLTKQGTLLALTPVDMSNSDKVRVVCWMRCVFKGSPPLTPEEAIAVEANDMVAMEAIAQRRAAATVAQLEEVLGPPPVPVVGEGGVPPGRSTRPVRTPHAGVELQAILDQLSEMYTKVRPVFDGHLYSRGDEALGVEPNGIPPSGFTYPLLSSVIAKATPLSHLLRIDFSDWYYSLRLSPQGRSMCCVAARDPQGVVHYFQLTRCAMGAACSPALAECVSGLIVAIANARGCATATNDGFHAQCDDLLFCGTPEEVEAAKAILLPIFPVVHAVEAAHKRVSGARCECLGKVFDFAAAEVTVPAARMLKSLTTMHRSLLCLKHADPRVRAQITPASLSKCVGTMGWLAETMAEGSLHVANLYAVTAGTKSLHTACWRDGVIEDLEWWIAAARSGDIVGSLRMDHHPSHQVEVVAMDASGVAVGAVLARLRLTAWKAFTPGQQKTSSARRELRAMLLALRAFGPRIRGATVVLLSDSVGAVMAVNKGRLRSKGLSKPKQRREAQKTMRLIYRCQRKYDLHAVAMYYPREFLRVADAISKHATAAAYTLWAATSTPPYTPVL